MDILPRRGGWSQPRTTNAVDRAVRPLDPVPQCPKFGARFRSFSILYPFKPVNEMPSMNVR